MQDNTQAMKNDQQHGIAANIRGMPDELPEQTLDETVAHKGSAVQKSGRQEKPQTATPHPR